MSKEKAKLFSFSAMLKEQERKSTEPPAEHGIPDLPNMVSHTEQEQYPIPAEYGIPQSDELVSHTSANQATRIPEVKTPIFHEQIDDKTSTMPKYGIPQSGAMVSQTGELYRGSRARYQGRIAKALLKEIKQFCVQHDLALQEFMELSAVHYIQHVVSHTAPEIGDRDTLNEMIRFKSNEDIIMLYRQYTGNRWKPLDDRAAEAFNSTDRRCLEIGIIQTLANFKGRRINGFAYFVPEIEAMLEVNMGSETLDAMLRHRKKQYADKMSKRREGK